MESKNDSRTGVTYRIAAQIGSDSPVVRGVDRVKWSSQSVTEKSNDLCYARFTL